jgi:hypothetical protein
MLTKITKKRKIANTYLRKKCSKVTKKTKKVNNPISFSYIHQKFIERILEKSVSKDFPTALMEWRVCGYRLNEGERGYMNHKCLLCDKDELIHLFKIVNILTGEVIEIVGSHCIFRHFTFDEQLKSVIRFLKINIRGRKMLYGIHKGEKIIDVLEKHQNYIQGEIQYRNELNDYLKSNSSMKQTRRDRLEESFKCMELLYLIHIRKEFIHIDNYHLENYLLNQTKYPNPYEKNYKRLSTACILNFIKTES